ncbi:MAG: WD40/YVTN/BNR-like repeat-containing protein, partial [bacterium]
MRQFIVGLILILPGVLSAQWQARSPGTAKDLSSLFFLDEQRGWIVYPDSCVLTTDGGLSWQNEKVTSGNKPLYDVAFANSQRGIAVTKNDTIFRSSDGGVNWFPVDTQTDDKTYFGVAFLEDFGRHAWIVGSSETIAYSTDSGQSWTAQHSDFFILRDAYFINKNLGWVVGVNNTILHTEDGGRNNSWVVQQRNASSDDLLGVWFISAQIGWAVGENGLILRTINGGQIWEPQPAVTNVTLNKVSFIDSLNGVIVGANGLILHTKDGGKTWPNEGGGIETILNDVYYVNLENAWAIGDNGTLLYSRGSVFVLSPNGAEVLEGGTRQVITWDSNYLQNVRIEFSTDNGKSYKSVAQDRDIFDATTGSYSWTVPGDVNSDSCRIRITGVTKPTVFDSSDQVFTIFRPDSIAPRISVLDILPGEPFSRADLTVRVTIEDEHPVAAFLNYRQGGSRSYKESKMARDPADSTKFEATIDGFDVTLNGIEYFIEATDSSFNKNANTFADSSNPQYIEIFTDNETFSVSPSTPGTDEIYQMISIPLILDRKSISQVLEVEGVLGQY